MTKIEKFQKLLKDNNIDYYIINTGDYHLSEYISEYFKTRAFLSNFTGSAGTLLVGQNSSYLWADGRYFIQAARQIASQNITLMKMGQPGVPTITEFLSKNLKDNMSLAFDGKIYPAKSIEVIKEKIPTSINIISDIDLVDALWEERPSMPDSKLYLLDEGLTGTTYKEKLECLKEDFLVNNEDTFILSALEDQAWLYNMRASDIAYTPVFLAFSVINKNETTLYINKDKLDTTVSKYLANNSIIIKEYADFFNDIKDLSGKKLFVDPLKTSWYVYDSCKAKNNVFLKTNKTLELKAIKNSTEIKNTIQAHKLDGLVMTRFMRYIKEAVKTKNITEYDVCVWLEKARKAVKENIDLSFSTIAGYKDNAAMMHYAPTVDKTDTLKNEGFLLVDSGGHYTLGSTDITRTYALGPISDTEKLHFTTVLKSVIALSRAKFLDGCTGINLDVLAREPIWNLNIDYKCGTGHGVGHILGVHEGPNYFAWSPRANTTKIKQGMITTIEPGIYLEGEYGIRLEQEALCVFDKTNVHGTFLKFDILTLVPFDLDAIEPSLLTFEEKQYLNDYHKKVYNTYKDLLNKDELAWLKEYTREI